MSLVQAWTWFCLPRTLTLQLRPSFALALVLLGGLVPLAFSRDPEVDVAEMAVGGDEVPTVLVQFRLDAPQARSVALAGTFSKWQPEIHLRESAPGVWTAIVPLRAGVHDYLFLVDAAEWVTDPARGQVGDDFDGVNSRLFLTLPRSSL